MVDGCGKATGSAEQAAVAAAAEYTLMSIDTIINGKVGAPPLPAPCALGTSRLRLTALPTSCRKGYSRG